MPGERTWPNPLTKATLRSLTPSALGRVWTRVFATVVFVVASLLFHLDSSGLNPSPRVGRPLPQAGRDNSFSAESLISGLAPFGPES